MGTLTKSLAYIYNHNNFLLVFLGFISLIGFALYYLAGNYTIYEKKSDGSEFIGYKHDLEYANLPMITGIEYNLVRERKPERVAEITKDNIKKITIMAHAGKIDYEEESDIAVGNYIGGWVKPVYKLQPNGSEILVYHSIYKKSNKNYKLSKYKLSNETQKIISDSKYELDNFKPLESVGNNDMDNIKLLCKSCHKSITGFEQCYEAYFFEIIKRNEKRT
jgi:hypothetical protein